MTPRPSPLTLVLPATLTTLAALTVEAAAGSVMVVDLDRSMRAGDLEESRGLDAGLAWSDSLIRITRPALGQVVTHGPVMHDSSVILGDDVIRVTADLRSAASVSIDLEAVRRMSPMLATPVDEFATSGAAFSLTFEIDRPYEYAFDGTFGSEGESAAFWSGLGIAGSTQTADADPWNLDRTGTLQPGAHTLDASLLAAAALVGPADPTGSAWSSFSFSARALPAAPPPPATVAVPTPVAAVWGTAALMMILNMRRRRDHA